MAFGKEIKRLRKKHNVSAQLFADATGVDADRLRKWELNDFNPKAEDTQLLEQYFGMPLSELMKQENLPKVPKKGEKYQPLPVVEDGRETYGVKVVVEPGCNEVRIENRFLKQRISDLEKTIEDKNEIIVLQRALLPPTGKASA